MQLKKEGEERECEGHCQLKNKAHNQSERDEIKARTPCARLLDASMENDAWYGLLLRL